MKVAILFLFAIPICSCADLLADSAWPVEVPQYMIIEHLRSRRDANPPAAQISYRPYSQAPSQIKQLLQFQQAREPLVHIPSQPPPELRPAKPIEPQYQTQSQVSQYNPQVQYGSVPQQPTYQAQTEKARAQYQPQQAQAQQYSPQYRNQAPQQAQHSQPDYRAAYRPVLQPQAAPQQPQYSNKLPPQIQQLLQVQAQLPNSIPQGHPQGNPQGPPQSQVFRPEQRRLY